MAAKGTMKKGGGGRKHGTCKNRPCQERYVKENRCAHNKIKRAQRYANKFNVEVIIKSKGEDYNIRPKV